MFKRLKRWFDSKRGKDTVIVVLMLALVASLVVQFTGVSGVAGWLTGTVGAANEGYTCLPTCTEDDGRFLAVTEEFGGHAVVAWVEVPDGESSFELGIFDGDTGLDSAGILNAGEGNWDTVQAEVSYTLYADPAMDGTGDVVVGTWLGNESAMPNHGWHDLVVDNVDAALRPEGGHAYRLVASWVPGSGDPGISAFKLRSTGRLTTGRADVSGVSLGLVGMLATRRDILILYPEFDDDDWSQPGPSTYDGEWTFYFEVPADTQTLRIWDGDFDRGPYADVAPDTDDPDTDGIPPWADAALTRPEGAGGAGDPPDDYNWPLVMRQPPAWYELIGPEESAGGQPIFRNDDPSGDSEWEAFVVSADPGVAADVHVDAIPPGQYILRIGGLDLTNTVWLRVDFELADRPAGEPLPTAPPGPSQLSLRACRGKPADILYVVDTSATMGQLYQGAGSKLAAAQEAIMMLNEWVVKLDNGSRVALVAFNGPDEGFGEPPLYPPDIQLLAPFTQDIRTVNTRLLGLNPGGTKPTAAALSTVADLLAGTVDPQHTPVMILISDGVPTVDFDRYRFDSAAVQSVAIYSGDAAQPPDVVRSAGAFSDLYGQAAGEPLADTMVAANALRAAMPEMPIYVLSVQAPHVGTFNDEILQYIAEVGEGALFTVDDAEALLEALEAIYAEETCDEAANLEPVAIVTPEVGPDTCAGYQLVTQQKDGRRRVRLVVANSGDEPVLAKQLTLDQWPEAWGSLEQVKAFGGGWIPVNGAAPASVQIDGASLRGGTDGEILLQFAVEVPEGVTSVTGYLEMQSGCRISIGAVGRANLERESQGEAQP